MDRKEWQEFLKSVQNWTSPIPQYEKTKRGIEDWYSKQERSKK